MAKLYFRYGAMGASKTANALMVRHNYLEKGQNAVLLKPGIETRDGESIIKSRIGLTAECQYVEDFILFMDSQWKNDADNSEQSIAAVIVDEAQFLTAGQVDWLSDLVDFYDIPVLCYGLRTDFQGHLFEGSRRLMELSDVIEGMPTVCWCGRRADFNARTSDGKIVRHGVQILLGGNETYVSLCRRHFKTGEISGPRSASGNVLDNAAER